MVPDIKIVQDLKFLQQIFSKFPEAGNQINIVMVGQVGSETKENGHFNLETYINELPHPRLKNLIREAKSIALKKFPNDTLAGEWLGGSRRLITYHNQISEEDLG